MECDCGGMSGSGVSYRASAAGWTRVALFGCVQGGEARFLIADVQLDDGYGESPVCEASVPIEKVPDGVRQTPLFNVVAAGMGLFTVEAADGGGALDVEEDSELAERYEDAVDQMIAEDENETVVADGGGD